MYRHTYPAKDTLQMKSMDLYMPFFRYTIIIIIIPITTVAELVITII